MPSESHHTIELEEGFQCDAKTLYEAFTDARLVHGYTQSPAIIDAKTGGEFAMFDGSITGKFAKTIPPTLIEETWRRKEWDDGEYSTVTITFTDVSRGVCRLNLRQTGIPDTDKYGNRDQAEKVKQGWVEYFFHRIHQVLGYGRAAV